MKKILTSLAAVIIFMTAADLTASDPENIFLRQQPEISRLLKNS